MLKRRIRTLAVTGITIVAAALVTLSTTAASAATTVASAPGHVTAPQAAEAATGCVTIQFGTWDENTYERCVRDEQILLNDLHYGLVDGMNRAPLLTVDGYYGPHTYGVVRFFQGQIDITQDGITGPQTWHALCDIAGNTGYQGVYWHDAGCPSIYY
jgi:peptidoglycan hydrolase-like protein with peptidoglycan-binding domain